MYLLQKLTRLRALTTLRANDDKKIQSINSTEIYAYGTSKDLLCKKRRN